jgi:crotonobetainyl-CoA:carnitine CoA-transferase CaiB-like acyl-CoA transferase
MSRPFEGIRVIDITHVLAGPFASYQLALLGADVIKVEEPKEGDQARQTGPEKELNRRKMGASFLNQASNKRCITLDLKTEEGREILRTLVRTADVLVENFRSGAMRSLGLGYEDLREFNPRLIYCSLTAWGQDGPRGRHTAYDQVIQGYSGVMSITGRPDTGPLRCGPQLLDFGLGTTAAFAISSALFQRERTGKGQHIDGCLTDVAFIMMSAQITGSMLTGKELGPQTTDRGHASHSSYPTKDGQLMVGASNTAQHTRLFDALGMPEMGNKSYEYRSAHRDEEAAVLREVFMTRTAAEWEEFLQARHVPAARVRTVAEAVHDPQVKTRAIHHRHESVPGVDGPVTVPIAAFKFAKDGPRVDTPPARLGAHNDEILGELGYSKADITRLRETGII